MHSPFFFLCDSKGDLERQLYQFIEQQKTQQQALHTDQDENNDKLALLRNKIRLTHQSVQRMKNILIHTIFVCLNVYTLLKTRFDAIISKVLTVNFFSLRNYTCHKLAHCTHTLKPFAPPSTLIETFFPHHFISCHGSHYSTILASHTTSYNCERTSRWRIPISQQVDTSHTIGIRRHLIWTANSNKSHEVT